MLTLGSKRLFLQIHINLIMAKSKPIGVRFDLDKLDMIQKEQNLTSVQQVVNYLMDNYGSKKLKEERLSRICLLTTQVAQI